jgi:glycyl-tRNA synthetase
MTPSFDFQTIIMTLQRFWAEQGCLIWQPYYTQVGAGTYNPATYLRVLGPEPWNVAYVEPSIRPDDGRYGKNPNRLQQHYQFQVILKPDPGNPQELYLSSLEALGIDPRRHDIRFVEDNWESPALGAWGLGWEVWLDGQEITQFTYFQQAGGMAIDPVAVEITYGLERIAMPLQRVHNFQEIRWSGLLKYGDVNLKGEFEHSKYYFEVANVERMREMFRLFEAEAEAALIQGLVLPAHDYILKCSHTFNILDTRGAIGVTERQAFFARMRDLSRRSAEAYVAQRQELQHPWLKESPSGKPASSEMVTAENKPSPSAPAAFLLEIGTEELPAGDLQSALAQLQESVPVMFADLHLAHGEVHILGTPRRLVISVADLAERQADQTVIVKGPPVNRAFDADGQPTPAALGFARSRGVDVSQLEKREMDGGQYLAVEVYEPGKPVLEVLCAALPGLVMGIKFDKTMRWNASNIAFSRPIRWLMALFGNVVVPFSYAGLQSSSRTCGLRFHDPVEYEISSPDQYFKVLNDQGIILDNQARQKIIANQVNKLAVEAGGVPEIDKNLLAEVSHLVEAPTAFLGKFDPSHLDLPSIVLVSVMKKHQRYFPVLKADGSLLPRFIAVRNGDIQHLDIVADGNEQVIAARFADAAFFISEDLKVKLEDLLPRLGTLTFQLKLGSMLDKSKRIERLVERMAHIYHLEGKDYSTAQRAAHLCKADLVSHMVIEMTSVQGAMGRYYAIHCDEDQAVADAIYEHYLPRFAGDQLPSSKAGLFISLADRLDSLAGLFAAGLAPSGTKDPFAQRRAAQGLVQSLIGWDFDFDLRQGLELACESLPVESPAGVLEECLDFISGRLQSTLLDQDCRYDWVEAVLDSQAHNPAGAARAVRELSEWVTRSDWNTILPAFARCVRITRDQAQIYEIFPQAFNEAAEIELNEAILTAEKTNRHPGSIPDFFSAFMPIIPLINRFFDSVLVMTEDPVQRANRLGLLQKVAALADGVADFSKLEGF